MKVQVFVQDQKLFASDSDAQCSIEAGALEVSNDDNGIAMDLLFVYVMRQGQYAKIQIVDEVEVIRIND